MADYVTDDAGRLRFADTFPGDWPGVPAHLHRWQTEIFEVRSGQLRIVLPDGPRIIGPGEHAVIPPMVVPA